MYFQYGKEIATHTRLSLRYLPFSGRLKPEDALTTRQRSQLAPYRVFLKKPVLYYRLSSIFYICLDEYLLLSPLAGSPPQKKSEKQSTKELTLVDIGLFYPVENSSVIDK
jgi:hypothetical protein